MGRRDLWGRNKKREKAEKAIIWIWASNIENFERVGPDIFIVVYWGHGNKEH